ncbi:MAG: GntR family transcriptional regulator [Clostridia bacterium]|nr:GntR family transcriptional regulator [Clostridia bacterium]
MLIIDRNTSIPVYEQIIRQMERLILAGVYPPGAPLPSVRTLSQNLEINPNTLQKAFAELEMRGICFSVTGTGRFVAEDAKERLRNEADPLLAQLDALCSRLLMLGFDEEALLARIRALKSEKEADLHD